MKRSSENEKVALHPFEEVLKRLVSAPRAEIQKRIEPAPKDPFHIVSDTSTSYAPQSAREALKLDF